MFLFFSAIEAAKLFTFPKQKSSSNRLPSRAVCTFVNIHRALCASVRVQANRYFMKLIVKHEAQPEHEVIINAVWCDIGSHKISEIDS
jgi:hypothetical protein